MLNYPTVTKDNLHQYIDAQFPILYICTFDENKGDEYIKQVAEKKVLEWNGANGFVDFKQNHLTNPTIEQQVTQQKLLKVC